MVSQENDSPKHIGQRLDKELLARSLLQLSLPQKHESPAGAEQPEEKD
jgi:hypothetical protein